MTPSIKLHSITFGVATALVFTLWSKLFELSQLNATVKIVLGALISLGLYRLIATGLIYLVKTSTAVKKLFLGTYFMEGTWVGFYIGQSGSPRFIIERFEQEIDTLTIRGKSYNEASEYHNEWVAAHVNIDTLHARISYMYECMNIHENTNKNGIAVFNFDRRNQYSSPHRLTGYSADLNIGRRIKALEIKMSDLGKVTEEEALQKAKDIYNSHKNQF